MPSVNKLAKYYLYTMGGLFFVYGLGYTLFPLELSEMITGGILTTPSSVTDVRANYGGFSIGIGLWLAISARRNIRVGALGLMAVFFAAIATRIAGIMLENHSNAYMYILLAVESYFFASALVVWYKVK